MQYQKDKHTKLYAWQILILADVKLAIFTIDFLLNNKLSFQEHPVKLIGLNIKSFCNSIL